MKINTKIITYFLGFLLLINGGFMFLSALLSYIYKDGITGDLIISGTISGFAGACYGILFGYVGASFATVSYSIFPLLWVLIGGAGTVLGPLVGAIFMFYLIDYASDITDAYMIIVGVSLLIVTLFARRGLLGELRYRFFKWIP